MNQFDRLMDVLREGITLGGKNFGLFVPNIVSLLITGFAVIISIVISIALGVAGYYNFDFKGAAVEDYLKAALPIIIMFLVIFGIVLPTIYCMVEAGILWMCRIAAETGKAGLAEFFYGLKKYWLKILIGLSIVGLVFIGYYLIGFVFFTMGEILTLGYGFAFAWVIINIFFGTWGAIMVVDEISAWETIKKGVYFGKKNFLALFIIFFAPIPIAATLAALVNAVPLAGFVAAPIAAVIINTYFKLVLVVYYRSTSEIDHAASEVEQHD